MRARKAKKSMPSKGVPRASSDARHPPCRAPRGRNCPRGPPSLRGSVLGLRPFGANPASEAAQTTAPSTFETVLSNGHLRPCCPTDCGTALVDPSASSETDPRTKPSESGPRTGPSESDRPRGRLGDGPSNFPRGVVVLGVVVLEELPDQRPWRGRNSKRNGPCSAAPRPGVVFGTHAVGTRFTCRWNALPRDGADAPMAFEKGASVTLLEGPSNKGQRSEGRPLQDRFWDGPSASAQPKVPNRKVSTGKSPTESVQWVQRIVSNGKV